MKLLTNVLQMFVPNRLPDGSERRVVADQPVIVYKPEQHIKVGGLTFVITAANMPLSKYNSIIKALNSADHVVVGFFVNVAHPLFDNHRAKAAKIAQIFQELQEEFQVKTYDIVGHSIGRKIALLTAALYDEDNLIRSIVALDPVDQHPVEFTKVIRPKKELGPSWVHEDGALSLPNQFEEETSSEASTSTSSSRWGQRTNLSLEFSKADITITDTGTGYWVNKRHNANAIHESNPSTKLVMHRNSCHMVYCDDGGLLSWKTFTGRGKCAQSNQLIRKETFAIVKECAVRTTIRSLAKSSVLSMARMMGSSSEAHSRSELVSKEAMMAFIKERAQQQSDETATILEGATSLVDEQPLSESTRTALTEDMSESARAGLAETPIDQLDENSESKNKIATGKGLHLSIEHFPSINIPIVKKDLHLPSVPKVKVRVDNLHVPSVGDLHLPSIPKVKVRVDDLHVPSVGDIRNITIVKKDLHLPSVPKVKVRVDDLHVPGVGDIGLSSLPRVHKPHLPFLPTSIHDASSVLTSSVGAAKQASGKASSKMGMAKKAVTSATLEFRGDVLSDLNEFKNETKKVGTMFKNVGHMSKGVLTMKL